MRKRYVALVVAFLGLAFPAGAFAHARSATVALDYRLVLDRRPAPLRPVGVSILDGDRSLRLDTGSTTVVVLGDLGEPMLRVGPGGAWANRASPTAAGQRLVSSGKGWKRVGGADFAWHDHRLAPPPYDDGRTGAVARFTIPVRVDGRRLAISGTFVRYARPSFWPWVGAVLGVVAMLTAAAHRRRAWRPALVLASGIIAGAAAVLSLAAFDAADAPSGRTPWPEIAVAIALAAAVAYALVRVRDERRIVVAGVVGACAAVANIGSLGIFRHGVVISLLPAAAARSAAAVAVSFGVAALLMLMSRTSITKGR